MPGSFCGANRISRPTWRLFFSFLQHSRWFERDFLALRRGNPPLFLSPHPPFLSLALSFCHFLSPSPHCLPFSLFFSRVQHRLPSHLAPALFPAPGKLVAMGRLGFSTTESARLLLFTVFGKKVCVKLSWLLTAVCVSVWACTCTACVWPLLAPCARVFLYFHELAYFTHYLSPHLGGKKRASNVRRVVVLSLPEAVLTAVRDVLLLPWYCRLHSRFFNPFLTLSPETEVI